MCDSFKSQFSEVTDFMKSSECTIRIKNTFLDFGVHPNFYETCESDDVFLASRETSFRSQALTCPDFSDGEFPSFDSTSTCGESEPSTPESSPLNVIDRLPSWSDDHQCIASYSDASHPNQGDSMLRPSQTLIRVMPMPMAVMPMAPMQPNASLFSTEDGNAAEISELAKAWLLRAERAKSVAAALRLQIDLEEKQIGNGIVPTQPTGAMSINVSTDDSLHSAALLGQVSTDHALGKCSPCAWFHSKKGCQNGYACDWCHACGPREIKRRRKEKARLLNASKK